MTKLPPIEKPRRPLPFYNEQWSLEEKIARLRRLAPEKVEALAILADDALRRAWPVQPDPLGRGRKPLSATGCEAQATQPRAVDESRLPRHLRHDYIMRVGGFTEGFVRRAEEKKNKKPTDGGAR